MAANLSIAELCWIHTGVSFAYWSITEKWQSHPLVRLYWGGGVQEKWQATWAERWQHTCLEVDCSAGSRCWQPEVFCPAGAASLARHGGILAEGRDQRHGPATQYKTSAAITTSAVVMGHHGHTGLHTQWPNIYMIRFHSIDSLLHQVRLNI